MFTLLWQLIIGALAGSAAGKFMDSGKHGFFYNAILGTAGGLVGGVAGKYLGLSGFLVEFVLAIGGACVVIWAGRMLKKSSK